MNRVLNSFSCFCVATMLLGIPTCGGAENTVVIERIADDIRYLASDELEGRGPATKGLALAAEYIRDEFTQAGLKSGVDDGSFMQPFEVAIDTKLIEQKTSLVLHGPDDQKIVLELGRDFQPLAVGGTGKVRVDVVFAGYGIAADKHKYNDYKAGDVQGKAVLIIRREPQQDNSKSVFDGKKVTSHSYIRTKVQAAKKHKAAAILLVNDPFSTKPKKKDELSKPNGFGARGMGIPLAHLSQATANRLLKQSPIETAANDKLDNLESIETAIDGNLKPITQPLKGWTAELEFTFDRVHAKVANVVGVLEGEGPHADETIILGAHYDHLGYGPFGSRKPEPREVHNGADDNASGTAAVVELARRFGGREKRPARRLVFIAFSAEERGLIGSAHYVEKPLFPLDKTVTMLNFDMIGRLRKDGLILGGVRTAKQFAKLVEAVTIDGKLKVKTSGPMGGSDHTSFYRKNIPAMNFFTGMTKEYHTPQDDFETINVAGAAQTIDFAERLLIQIAGLPERPVYVKSAKPARGGGQMAYLGVVPDYAGTNDGLRITDVNAESPAAKGGLKADDVIIKIGEITVADIQGLADGLRKYKSGTTVDIVVQRGKEKKSLKVTLGKPPAKK
ncbi:MAG: M20/M25/M40 family metallo-hydrolase [Planctomycetota bacterium]|nr:M20/M25/M40 family metallo-hydrolase [Planctomycetota bacterium]